MGKIVESIQGFTASVIQAHKGEMALDKVDDRAAVHLGIILISGALEVVAVYAARREAKTSDGAEANWALAGDVQRRIERQIVDACGLEPHTAARLTSDVLRAANRCQPDLKSLRHDLFGDGSKSGTCE